MCVRTNKVAVRPAKTQISLGIRQVWSKSSLSALWVAKDPVIVNADSEDSDQTGRMTRVQDNNASLNLGSTLSRTEIKHMKI